jgi:hypothetical protein
MSREFSPSIILTAVTEPSNGFAELSRCEPSPLSVIFKCSIWLLLLPPVIFYFGASAFGWDLGADEPLHLSSKALALVSACYFMALLFGFFSTAFISRWMASTYGAKTSLGLHLALITVIGVPLAVVSMGQWYPNVFLNMLILIPAMIWSMVLLYKGIPIVLGISPEKGMLMASSLVGWLLVAAVSLLGISMALWTMGFGPFLGV